MGESNIGGRRRKKEWKSDQELGWLDEDVKEEE